MSLKAQDTVTLIEEIILFLVTVEHGELGLVAFICSLNPRLAYLSLGFHVLL
jgi:hypothetical protein